jgi:ketosteroid isomerase-like protein
MGTATGKARVITGKEWVAFVQQKGCEQEPVQALAEFYRAFNSGDLGLMAENWGQAPEVLRVDEADLREGKAQYREDSPILLQEKERNWKDASPFLGQGEPIVGKGEELVMNNPLGGMKRGWEEIRGVYERIFSSGASVAVEFYDYTIHLHGELFYAVGRERGRFEGKGKTLDLKIRTTRIFRRDGSGRWRQVHHHGSIEDAESLAAYQAAVR